MADFDLHAARLARLQQEFDALLPQDDLNLRQVMVAWVADGARQGVDLIPSFHDALRTVRSQFPASSPAGVGNTPSGSGPDLEMEALPAAHCAILWPYRPKRLPDELLSSWLWRTARGLGAPPRRFAYDAVGARLADIDREIDDATIARLAFLSGQSEEHLLRGSMRADAPLASSDQRESVLQVLLRHGDLVLNGTHRGRSKPIIQYCPICLGRDDAAYLRRGWRFSIEAACFNDGCFLLDACWRCGALLDPLSSANPSTDFLCVRCGARLAAAPSLHMPETVTDPTILYQTLAILLFSAGRDHITIRGEEYIEELSSGALRGTNPANAADRHYATMSEAWRICTAAPRANARFGTRRWAKARARGGTKLSPGQADSAPPLERA